MRMAAAAGLAACVGMVAGCGNTYRPVLATIGAIGPAGQPTKYAIAVSTPTPPGNPCPLPGQPTSNGLVTFVDFSGDTILDTTQIGVNPYYFWLSSGGGTGYTLNCDKTLNSFNVSTSLIASQVQESTLPPGANPVSLFTTANATYLADPGVEAIDQLTSAPPALKQQLPVPAGYTPIYVAGQQGAPRLYAISQAMNGGPGVVSAIETSGNTVSATLPVGVAPVYGVMSQDLRRAFILNQGDNTVSVINVPNNVLDQFPDPLHTYKITGFSITNNVVTFTAANSLHAGMNITINGLANGAFLNGQTLTVLPAGLSATQFEATFTNSNVAFTADSGTAAALTSTINVGPRPVWADFASGLNELVITNEGDGTNPGSVTIINVPLCSATALPTNPNCNAANPVDASSFGTVAATVPVGVNPIMVSVLADNTRAYVLNAGNATTLGSVSVVNLLSNTVTATIPISGHPVYIATANSTPTGKVYVVCKDSEVMTVIKTDTDSFYTTIPLQGYGVSVRTTSP